MAAVCTAQMARRRGRWRLYVVLFHTPAWPERDLGGGAAVPTVQQRSRALQALGYALIDGARWEWTEDSETPDDPASAVLLIASVTVREAGA
ncbi:DUF6303 family protein [Streptomyces griseoflavus]|uniref:Uncharacterized protein n=1 Tax=Streptomyces griseoflavus Tu4000 TaxID=467200 RepID=D9XWH3_9ACTN|nr:DUF6303 family protein [Streptomyces griseoflavus]EFL39747.1 conserved hypothetical protein [Streptomyces griseoflavus Tu4000]